MRLRFSLAMRLAHVHNTQTCGGGSDSYFEYLIKWARLSNTDDNTFANNWLTAADTSIKILAKVRGASQCLRSFIVSRCLQSHVSHLNLIAICLESFTDCSFLPPDDKQRATVDDWLFLADFDDNRQIRHIGSHLACFYGGNWLLGGC